MRAAESFGVGEWVVEGAKPGRDVCLRLTETFVADAFRRQALAGAWPAIDRRLDPVAALRFER